MPRPLRCHAASGPRRRFLHAGSQDRGACPARARGIEGTPIRLATTAAADRFRQRSKEAAQPRRRCFPCSAAKVHRGFGDEPPSCQAQERQPGGKADNPLIQRRNESTSVMGGARARPAVRPVAAHHAVLASSTCRWNSAPPPIRSDRPDRGGRRLGPRWRPCSAGRGPPAADRVVGADAHARQVPWARGGRAFLRQHLKDLERFSPGNAK